VEVYLPEEVQGEGEVGSSVASTAAGSAASTAPDIASLVEKALAKLPPEMAAEAKDPKRKAKSRDPGWQFGWWPDIAKKDSVQCIFCKTITPSGISRFKQHLAGGYGDAIGCPSCPEIVRRQMDAYIKKNTRSRVLVVPEVQQDSEEGEGDEVEEVEPEKMPSSGTKTKQKKAAAKKVSRFLYKHGRLLDLMRQKIGGDLVRPAVTRFATSYLTLASMYKHKNGLRNLVVSEEWHNNSLSRSAEGKRVENIILSATFWTKMEDCLKASQPLLIALRIADGDETPAAPEITAAMDVAKSTIKESLKHNTDLRDEVLALYNTRWDTQMEQKLYGAALFLNPSKFFAIREKDKRQASRLRGMFNQVLWKMEPNDEVSSKISQQADDYELSAGESFSMPLAIRDRDKKNPSKFRTFFFPLVVLILFCYELILV